MRRRSTSSPTPITGERAAIVEFLKLQWDSILKAYRFSDATDTDGDGLIENTGVGHGWVEGGALYPAHEEIYMQGLWVEALAGIAELAAAMQDQTLAVAGADCQRTSRRDTRENLLAGGSRILRVCDEAASIASHPSPSPGHSGNGARSASMR